MKILNIVSARTTPRTPTAGGWVNSKPAKVDQKYAGVDNERDPCLPSTPYGRAKLELSRALAASHRDSAWGRIFFPFGPHEAPTRLVPSVIRALLKREAADCTHGAQVRDVLYVEDLGHAFATLLDSSLRGPVNVASGEE